MQVTKKKFNIRRYIRYLNGQAVCTLNAHLRAFLIASASRRSCDHRLTRLRAIPQCEDVKDWEWPNSLVSWVQSWIGSTTFKTVNALQTVSAFGMSQSEFTHFHDGHREGNAAKAGFRGQAVQCSSPRPPEEFQDSLEHDAWSPNTPTMTRGSSRSTSSTIIACENCGNPSNQCGCQSQSDSESVRFHVAETE
jgi:hypothetical protein